MRPIRKKRDTGGINIPGKVFEKHIQYGIPSIQGVYLCFYKPYKISDEVYPVAGMEITNWHKGKWATKNMVVAFMGPLPVPLLDELYDNKECIHVAFCIGTLKGAVKGLYESGPHFQFRAAQIQTGRKGWFIFKIHRQKTIPFPIAKYDTDQSKWVIIKNQDKYLMIMDKYRKQ